jgi:signal transduction histidine kinase/phage shock protein PspC (stress-responsive transcriptional regulator)
MDAPPPLRRPRQGRWIGGVCAGLAQHLGVSVHLVRVVFVLLSLVQGLGVVLYAGLWLAVPAADRPDRLAPGLAAADRLGLRPRRGRPQGSDARREPGLLIAVGLVLVGAAILVDRYVLGPTDQPLWPLVVVAIGGALVWHQSDRQEHRGAADAARVVVGVSVVALGVVLFLAGRGELRSLLNALGALAVVLAGIALVTGPWVVRLWRDLERERAERVRTQERADVAAHLHDSVLQTLAVVQRQAHDPALVTRLARQQERELRRWLYEAADDEATALEPALAGVAAEVEDTFGIRVETVVVGSAPITPAVAALVAATKEAVVNAAKHAHVEQVDVFAEVGDDAVEVFVRDRGVGFDPAQVATDRYGIRSSIVARLTRVGGNASVRSRPGTGTEVELSIPLTAASARPREEAS